jgi:hypothetical protein
MMANSPNLRRALERAEARRIELERQIVSELEELFFSDPEPEVAHWVIHNGVGKEMMILGVDDTTTASRSQFVTTWFVP